MQPVETLSRYRLLRRLSVSENAELFLAHEGGLGGLARIVIIKRIHPNLSRELSSVDSFLREARILAQLSHPNVVHVHELGEEDGSYFIVFEYLHGVSTHKLARMASAANLAIPIDVAVAIIAQTCRGLHAAHELHGDDGEPLGLVHRDVSPHNLMVTLEGQVKIFDFGIAKTATGLDSTYTGARKGKLGYMSPEQCLNLDLDRRSDIFSLGTLFWELCTGKQLFARATEMEIMHAVTGGDIPCPSEFLPHFPEVLIPIINRALERDRSRRYRNADEMRLDLLAAAEAVDLDLGDDNVADFVHAVAGEEIATRERDARKAYVDVPQDPIQVGSSGAHVRVPPPRPIAEGGGGNKLWILAVLVLLAVGGGAFAVTYFSAEPQSNIPPGPALEGPSLVVGWPPYVEADLLLDDIAPLRDYLEQRLGQPIEFAVADSYEACSFSVRSGEYDFAALPPLLYIDTQAAEPGIDLLAIKEFDGARSYDGWLMVSADSSARTLADLRGKTFCFPDENSTSGYFLPLHFLRQNGIDPDQFIGEVVWSGNHFRALQDAVAGRCEVVATYNGAVFSAGSEGIPVGGLRVLAITGVIPQDVIVASPETTEADRARFTNALLDFDPMDDLNIERVGVVQRVTGFSVVDDAIFDDLRQIRENSPE